MKSWLGILLIGFVSCVPAFGQAVSQISGVVRDQSGAVLPGVEITATQTETGIARTTVSNETGTYALPNLMIGPYKLEAALPGFRTFVQTGIVLQVGTSPVFPITLEVGQVSETVQVEANVAQVEQRSVGVGTVVETQRVIDLPLNGREPYQLLTLSGAAVQYAGTGPGDMQTGAQIQVAGGTVSGVQYNLDGASHMNYYSGDSNVLPFPDALQEFKLSTSTQDPSSTGHSGAAVNIVTKSGTNAFHGDLFEFARNYAFNARDYFATAGDGLKRNQFGGTLGGALKKDKLFFFFGYQGTTVRQTPIASQTFVPTQQMLRGDFSTFASPACQNGRQVTLRAPFVNNRIDPSQLSKVALAISAHLPAALNNCGLVYFGIPIAQDSHQVPVRVDYQVNQKHSLMARYLMALQNADIPLNRDPHNLLIAGGLGADDIAQSATVGDTYVINATTTNSFRLFANRLNTYSPGPTAPGPVSIGPAAVGMPMYSYAPDYLSISVSGAFAFGVGSGNNGYAYNTRKYDTSFGFNDDFTWVRGTHQFALGGSFTRDILWRVGNAFSGGMITIGATTGLGLADFELGILSSLRQQPPNLVNYRQDYPRMYAQDTWKITPRFTMTYGVVWSPFLGLRYQQGDTYNFSLPAFYARQRSTVIPTAPPGFTYPGDPGFPGKSGINSQWSHFDPRVGLAWDPAGDGKTAIRLGGGIGHDFVDGQMIGNQESALPFNFSSLQSGVTLDNPYPGGDPFPYFYNSRNPVYPSPAQIRCLASTCPPSFIPTPSDFKTTEQYSWNLGLQRQVRPSWFVSATYLGSHLIHTFNAVELNPAIYVPGNCAAGQYGLTAPGPCTQASNITQRRVLNLAHPNDPPLGYVTRTDDGGTQSYNGLLLTTKLQLANQVNLNANYTWAHCIGLGIGTKLPPGAGQLNPGQNYLHQGYGQNVYVPNRNLDNGDCYADRRHIANVTLVYQVPKFANRIARILGSDWRAASTFVANSGQPMTVTTASTTDPVTGYGNTTQRANVVLANTASPDKGKACTAAAFCVNWLNPAAFANPAPGTAGNEGAASILGPGFWQWDQAIIREFRIRETQKVEFRTEAYNITNSFHPGPPGLTVGSSTLGVITSDYTPPSATTAPARVLQFALKYVF